MEKSIKEQMMPVKRFLTIEEVCAYVSFSENTFMAVHRELNFSLRKLGKTKRVYWDVKEINRAIENNRISKQPKQ